MKNSHLFASAFAGATFHSLLPVLSFLFLSRQMDLAEAQMSNQELASYGLTITQVETLKNSESPADFGGLPSSGEQDDLWVDATEFEYDLSMSPAVSSSTSMTFYPYIVCNKSPDKSGDERQDMVEKAFNNTEGTTSSHFYVYDTLLHNQDDITCGVMRTTHWPLEKNTIAKVFESNPDAIEWMRVQPLLPSIKMSDNMVDTIQRRMDGDETTEDLISVANPSTNKDSPYVTRKLLGVQGLLCPGVHDYNKADGSNVTEQEIIESVKSFVLDDGGAAVKNSSFYYHRVYGHDGGNAVHTDRMNFWADSIHAVVYNFTDSEDATNACLDHILPTTMVFEIDSIVGMVLNVFANQHSADILALGATHGLSETEVDQCVWYMIMGMAVHPMICALEPQSEIVTLCKANNSTDLGNCPGAEEGNSNFVEGGEGEGDSGGDSSGSEESGGQSGSMTLSSYFGGSVVIMSSLLALIPSSFLV